MRAGVRQALSRSARGLSLPAHGWTVAGHFARRLRERDFWIVQGGIGLVTALHFTVEAALEAEPYYGFHSIPVILYMLPIAYASLRYRWEGGLCTGLWIFLLVLPSIALWHRSSFLWVGELTRVSVVIGVGVILISRVGVEARLRRRAEAVSAQLAASEAKFRALFEAAGDAILVCDRAEKVTSANAAAADLFNVSSPAALLSQGISDLVPAWSGDRLGPEWWGDNSRPPERVVVRGPGGQELVAEAVVAALPEGSGEEAFQVVLRDITARELREKGLRAFVREVTRAQEEERRRIARELHDDPLQTLALLAREMRGAADAEGIAPQVREHLRRLGGLAATTAESLRRFSRDLRPSVLDDLGLVPAIEWLSSQLNDRGPLRARFDVRGDQKRLPVHAELALFRIAQEGLRNVEKHADATAVLIELDFTQTSVTLTIRDDGQGFTVPTTIEELVLAGKLGLLGLRERAALAGGHLEIRSSPGRGTEIAVSIPA